MIKKIPPVLIRLAIVLFIFLVFFLMILLRLWNEQIRRGEEHRGKISRQSIREIRIPSVRGMIYSSDGRLLAGIEPTYDVVFHLAEMRQPGRRDRTIDFILESARQVNHRIGRTSKMTRDDIIHKINRTPGLPLPAAENLSLRELGMIVGMTPPIPGMDIETNPRRSYPEGETACHILGYSGPADPGKAEDRDKFFYYVSDIVGLSGIEARYNGPVETREGYVRGLCGTPGRSIVLVNYLGYIHDVLANPEKPENGNDLVLTIDYDAQKTIEQLLHRELEEHGREGAAVVLDADSGAVIAMASSPAFDLRDFVPNITRTDWRRLESDKRKPLFNRATLGEYTPGSIMKPLVALAILDGGISPLREIDCPGRASIGKTSIRCWSWRTGGHGEIPLLDAIKQSCNTYFIDLGRETGMENITAVMRDAALGKRTGFPLPERPGLVPERSDKKRLSPLAWNEFDTALLSIGQGMILVTPLQAALYAAAIANGGTVWQPFLVKEVRAPAGNVLVRTVPKIIGSLRSKTEHLELVQEGMRLVVNAPDGTAKSAANPFFEMAGKTGTAEVGPKDNRITNTWFIGFGEYNEKRYSMSVFIEKGMSGGRTSAPIAGKFFELWLTLKGYSPEDTGSL